MNLKTSLLFALSLTFAGIASAQDSAAAPLTTDEKIANVDGKVDGLNEAYLDTKATVDKLSHLSVSGYIQGQWQYSDTNGAAAGPFSGGAFGANTNQRFQLRRVRLKTTYDAGTSKYIMELDALPSGVVLKDAEVVLLEPWIKTFSLDFGLQDRPFGFEIPYSSSLLETPERSRGEQVEFKGEKDLGLTLGINPTDKMGFLQYLNLKAGVFTGTQGFGGGTGDEIDSTVDLIGRAGFKAPFNDMNLDIDGGISGYAGKSLSLADTAWTMNGTVRTASTGNLNKTLDRNALGLDLEVYYSIPVIGDYLGGTSLRGEYWTGKTPGTIASNAPYGAAAATTQAFTRNFSSWYITFIQNVTSSLQGVVRYDVFDPNTDVKGSDIGVAANKLSAQDLQYSTLGLGVNYFWDGNVKLLAYYEIITNEKANAAATGSLAPFTRDLNDNVLTLRAQVKF